MRSLLYRIPASGGEGEDNIHQTTHPPIHSFSRYMDYDLSLYDHCSTEYLRLEEEKTNKAAERERRWEAVQRLAQSTLVG